ncbi:MAG: hypothetical protein KatS3mg121_0929 [Gammaproteobacteria bacterium]|nr:MAG: hypothetical protein KatS3mg121_0929 [Gammaproteobacteria bacterium]
MPVVSGVGHEIDFTIADFVADLRAPTPSAAAELASPDAAAWLKRLATDRARLLRRLRERLARAALRLAAAQRALRRLDPRRRLLQDSQRLDELHGRMQRAMRRHLRQAGRRLEAARARLTPDRLAARLAAARRALPALRRGLLRHARRRLETARGRFEQTLHTLDAVGPLATLRRGYAAVFVAGRRAALREAAQAPPGTPLAIVLARGELEATVTAQHPHNRLERHAPEK